jgi:hypothetical protein
MAVAGTSGGEGGVEILAFRTMPARGERGPSKLQTGEIDDLARNFAATNVQLANADRQFEAARSGAGRIEVEHTVADFVHGRMRMPANDGRESRG